MEESELSTGTGNGGSGEDSKLYTDGQIQIQVQKHRDIDGGYAWVVMFASFMCHGLGNGLKQIFGILYTNILELYQADRFSTSWIITLQVLHWGLMGRFILF